MICNPCRSPKLVREVQPPHIYVRRDGRLKLSKQSTHINTTYFFPSNPCSCFRYSTTFLSSSNIDNRAKSDQIRIRSTNRCRLPPTGSLLRSWYVWFQKSRLPVLHIALGAGLPRGELWSISPGFAGTR